MEEAESEGSILASFSAPKEEWVLRWLMKKLKASGENGRAYRLNIGAWVLISQLLDRIPPRSLVAILSEHKLLEVLLNALIDIGTVLQPLRPNEPAAGQDQTSIDNKSKSKKRKHSAVEQSDHLGSLVDSPCDLFLAVTLFVKKYISLPRRLPANQFVLGSQIKLVLRGDSETISKILGLALHEASVSISGWHAEAKDPAARQLLPSLASVLELWNNRTTNTKQAGPASSNVSHFFGNLIFEQLQLINSTGRVLREYPAGGASFPIRGTEAPA